MYSDDPSERRALKGYGVDCGQRAPEQASSSSGEPAGSSVEPNWHSAGRQRTQSMSTSREGTKRRSQPLRQSVASSSGSGMKYQPRDLYPADSVSPGESISTLPEPTQGVGQGSGTPHPSTRSKTRSQPFRRHATPTGITLLISGPLAEQWLRSANGSQSHEGRGGLSAPSRGSPLQSHMGLR